MYQCHKPDSDFDFIGICDGDYFYAYRMIDTTVPNEKYPNAPAVSVNINMMHILYFKESLKDAFINSVMLCYIPKQFVLQELIDIHSEFVLHLPNIRQSVQMDSTHNFAKAKRLWRQGDYYTAKKNIVHGIRYLNYSLQLLGGEGRIYDFTVGNEYWAEVQALVEPTADEAKDSTVVQKLWKSIDERFAPIYDDLTLKMKRFCDVEVESAQAWEAAWLMKRFNCNAKQAASLFREALIPCDILLDYIREFGLDSISRSFGVTVSRHSTFKNLVSLSRTQQASLELSLVQWCSGIVLDEVDDLKVVAMPFIKMFATSSDANMLPVIDWKTSFASLTIQEHYDGKMAMLYWYKDSWKVASAESADGSEQIGWTSPIKLPNWTDYVVEGFNFNPVHQSRMLLQIEPGKPNPTFSSHFWDTFKQMEGASLDSLDLRYCYLFELMSPHLVNVVEYKKPRLALLAVRNLQDGAIELSADTAARKLSMECVPRKFVFSPTSDQLVQVHPLDSYIHEHPVTAEAIALSLRFLNPLETVGYVCKTADGRRLAFRSLQFLSLDRLHPLSDNGQSQRLLLELARCLAPRNWLEHPKYARWKDKFTVVDDECQAVCRTMQTSWNEVKKIIKEQGRGAGAAYLANYPTFSAELFHLIKLDLFHLSVADHLSRVPIKKLQGIIRRMTSEDQTAQPSNT